jgi:hypothetical protein
MNQHRRTLVAAGLGIGLCGLVRAQAPPSLISAAITCTAWLTC